MKSGKNIYLIVFIFLMIFSLPSCKPEEEISEAVKEDIEFAKKISAIEPVERVNYIYLDSLGDMISQTNTNLIVRGKTLSRGESAKYGKSGTIHTPYELEILEVYHGTVNKSGDIINFDALYGIFEDTEYRADKHPVFNIEKEYLLFLRVDEIYGELQYCLCFDPASSLILNPKDGTFEDHGIYSDYVFSKYDHDTEKLLTELKEFIADNDYNTKIDKYPEE